MLHRALFAALLSLVATPTIAKVAIGEAAPDFSLTDSNGRMQTLSQYRGKVVVLEWSNPNCPFVRKHYNSGNMQRQQSEATAGGAVWLTINSNGAKWKHGYVDGAGAAAFSAKYQAKQTAYLLDPEGSVGHLYGAKNTPQMFVIDARGILRYMGAIDSIASTDEEDLANATQYVPQALAELKAGNAVSVPVSKPYGCGVEYSDAQPPSK